MTINHEDLNLDALEIRALRFQKLNQLHECFDSTTVLALITRLREAEARAENGPCWDEGVTVPVPRGECAPLPPLCTLKAGHLGAHQAGGATWTRRAAGGIERKL